MAKKGFIKEEEQKPVLAGSGKKQYYVGSNPSEAGAGRGVVNPKLEDVNKHKWKGRVK